MPSFIRTTNKSTCEVIELSVCEDKAYLKISAITNAAPIFLILYMCQNLLCVFSTLCNTTVDDVSDMHSK